MCGEGTCKETLYKPRSHNIKIKSKLNQSKQKINTQFFIRNIFIKKKKTFFLNFFYGCLKVTKLSKFYHALYLKFLFVFIIVST